MCANNRALDGTRTVGTADSPTVSSSESAGKVVLVIGSSKKLRRQFRGFTSLAMRNLQPRHAVAPAGSYHMLTTCA